MKYGKLRIAWSVAWGIGCLLLIALWVRSYSYWDMSGGPVGTWHVFLFQSIRGHSFLAILKNESGQKAGAGWDAIVAKSLTDTEATGTAYSSTGTPLRGLVWEFTTEIDVLGIGVVQTPPVRYVVLPYWFLVASAATIAASSWSPWRFSLRTLLVAMTVTAIGLGWIVYALRN